MRKGLLLLLSLGLLASCSPKFYVFDAMYYRNKPDLEQQGVSKIKLIYESRLVTDGALDWQKIDRQILQTKEGGYKTVSIDIESWYDSRLKVSPEEVQLRLDSVFRAFREAIPGCEIGNYGVPVQNLNVQRHALAHAGITDEKTVMERWKASSKVREPAGNVSDILLPSLYIFNHDIDRWVEDLKIEMKYIREHYPGKKVYVYLWPQCYNLKWSPDYLLFLSGEQMLRMLEACYSLTDGVILWAAGRDTDDKTYISWDDPRVVEMWSGVEAFLRRHRIKALK